MLDFSGLLVDLIRQMCTVLESTFLTRQLNLQTEAIGKGFTELAAFELDVEGRMGFHKTEI